MHVLLGAMLIDALHAALEDREKPFDRLDLDRAVRWGNVLVPPVPNDAVVDEFPVDVQVVTGFVVINRVSRLRFSIRIGAMVLGGCCPCGL